MKTLKLNKVLYSAIITSSAISAGSVYAHNTKADPQFYVGADAVYSKLGFKQDYGKEMFSKKFAPGINLFAGHMFNENFGMELGWEMYKKMKRTAQVEEGKIAAGSLVPIGIRWRGFDTTVKQNYPYLGVVGKMGLMDNSIFASILLGIALPHIKTQYTTTATGIGPVNPTVRTFSNTKLIPIAKIAVEYKFNDNFGLRALATWKNTSRFKIKSKENSAGPAEIRLRDTFGIGLGATYYI